MLRDLDRIVITGSTRMAWELTDRLLVKRLNKHTKKENLHLSESERKVLSVLSHVPWVDHAHILHRFIIATEQSVPSIVKWEMWREDDRKVVSNSHELHRNQRRREDQRSRIILVDQTYMLVKSELRRLSWVNSKRDDSSRTLTLVSLNHTVLERFQ